MSTDTTTAPATLSPNDTDVVPTTGDDSHPDTLAHGYCMICRSRVAWCGYVRPAAPPFGSPQAPRRDRCIVCVEMRKQPCPTCGAPGTRPL